MVFADIVEQLPAYVVHRGSDFEEIALQNVVAGDLMSDVLVVEYENLLMVTSLNSEQILRTADMVGARGVLLVNDKAPFAAVKTLAREQDITFLSTPLSLFEACVALGRLMRPAP
ncbi:MAG: hypothetical protein LBK40_05245 [Spirochaetaceae bacterium]|nr:hypothetical protein [Spirochaetaceae bacterium]